LAGLPRRQGLGKVICWQLPRPSAWPVPTPYLAGGGHHVVAAVLLRADHVLLCHRSPGRRWYPDVWDFPGGHVQPGEDPGDALRRELAEELGIELEGLDGGPVLRRIDPDTGLDLTVWVARCWRGTARNLQPEEHDAIGWFERGQLEGLSFADPSYLTLLQRLLRMS
jgi:8-oxo-dGTP diphosphatase